MQVEQEGDSDSNLNGNFSELCGINIVSMQTCQDEQYAQKQKISYRISLSHQMEPIKWSPSNIFGKGEALKKEKHGM